MPGDTFAVKLRGKKVKNPQTGERAVLDFTYNAWGGKFPPWDKDNAVPRHVAEYFNLRRFQIPFVCEGGALEVNGAGDLLTTRSVILNENRNPGITESEAEEILCESLGVEQVLWLDHGYLAGDDTDSHIDTLARLCPNDTIVYVQCNDEQDEHYDALRRMEEQLKTFRTLSGDPYRLLPLPMADAVVEDGERLPATYANFLILNEAVLYPTYAQPDNDRRAAEVLQQAFPGYEIVGIDCRALICQHGSLHCVTMQYPEGVLK